MNKNQYFIIVFYIINKEWHDEKHRRYPVRFRQII